MSLEDLPYMERLFRGDEMPFDVGGSIKSGIKIGTGAGSKRAMQFIDDFLRQSKESYPITFKEGRPVLHRHFAERSVERLGSAVNGQEIGEIANGLISSGANLQDVKSLIKALSRFAARQTSRRDLPNRTKGPTPREGGPDISDDFYTDMR